MKTRMLLINLLVFSSLLLPARAALGAQADWETIIPGIDYQEFFLPDPNRVYVARMDRAVENVTIDSGLANGELGAGPEIVSRMAQRYDGALNTWAGEGWGARNRVVVAINGSYVDNNGFPQSGQIISGWYARRFDNQGGGSGFAWTLDRVPFVGGCVDHMPEKQVIQNLATQQTQRIAAVNAWREPEGLYLYTPQWGAHTATRNSGVEVLVEMDRPTLVYPGPRLSIRGVVREIRDGLGSTYIPFDHIVLSARGRARERLLEILHVGDEIGINQEIAHFERDCKTRNPQSWTTTYASVSGDYVFLENGEIRSFDDNAGALNRHPRTAIVYNDSYVYFIVVDGRQPDASIGMTIAELALFARDTLGASWGIALDGGGSSTMVINGIVKNHPSDPCNRIYLPLVGMENTTARRLSPPPSYPPRVSPTCERPVVNSVMMIAVEPKVQSVYFQPGEGVSTTREVELRLGPGTNYAPVANVPARLTGVIVPHSKPLDGVLAKGAYWWKVAFGGAVGWLPQDALARPLTNDYERFVPR
jgi:hypothetical protein